MKIYGVIIMLIIGVLFLVACSVPEGEPPIIISQEQSTPTSIAKDTSVAVSTAAHRWTESEEVTATATQLPEPTATFVPTTAPTETPEVAALVSDECLACHMDKERLIETAAPEEKSPSESSGVG